MDRVIFEGRIDDRHKDKGFMFELIPWFHSYLILYEWRGNSSGGGGLIGVKKVERESGECHFAKNMKITMVILIEKVVYLALPAEAAQAYGFTIL